MRGLVVRGVVGSVLTVAGGWCYAKIPQGTWVSRTPGLLALRASPHHLAWGLGLAFAGLALLTWSWWQLRPAVDTGPDGLRRVRRAAAVWSVPLVFAPPLFSGDGWSYVATGALTGRGLSPYIWTPSVLPPGLRSGVSLRWLHTPSPYGALPLEWGAALSHLTHDPWLLLLGYRLLAVLGLVLVAWAVPVLARRWGSDPARASWLVVTSPFMLAHGIGGLHNDLIMSGLMLAALVVTRRDWWLAGAVLAGLAAAVKAPGGLVAVGVVLLSLAPGVHLLHRLRRSAAVAGTTLGTLWGVGWVSGLGSGWIQALSVPGHEHTPLAITSVVGRNVRRLLLHSGTGGADLVRDVHPEVLARDIGVGLLLLLVLWTVLWRRNETPAQSGTGVATVLLAAVLLSPAVHYWYFLWCVPALACLRLSAGLRAALVTAVGVLGLAAVGDPALHVTWLWQGARWALVLAPALVWWLWQWPKGTPVAEKLLGLSWWSRGKSPAPTNSEERR